MNSIVAMIYCKQLRSMTTLGGHARRLPFSMVGRGSALKFPVYTPSSTVSSAPDQFDNMRRREIMVFGSYSSSRRQFHNIKSLSQNVAQQMTHTFEMLQEQMEKENTRRARKRYLRPLLTLSLIITCLLVGGVVWMDHMFHKRSGIDIDNNPILNKEVRDQSLVTDWIKNLQLDIKRYPVLYALIGANALVFLGVRLAMMNPMFVFFFEKHLSLSVANVIQGKRFYTILTSSFTHIGGLHLAFNMYALYNMAPLLIENLGTPTFLAFYFSAAVVSGLGALVVDLARGRLHRGSIGASGAVFAILAASIALMSDDARLGLIFLPNSISFDPKIFFPLYLVAEVLFNFVQKKVQLGTAAHVSGALFGYLILYLLLQQEHNKKPRNISLNMRNYYYQGDVAQFRMNGHGRMLTRSLAYEGDMRNDKFNGKGVLKSHDLIYSGDFKNGIPNGNGTVRKLNERGLVIGVASGTFKDGKKID